MKTILITGGCGYVGSRVAKVLVDAGEKVIVVDKATPEERNADLPASVEFRQVNLVDPVKTKEALRGADVILHLAANIGPLTYMRDHQAEILEENTAIDASVYPALREVGMPPIIYSSSSMVFQKSQVYPYRESDLDTVLLPTNVYGFSKLTGEYFCKAAKEQYGQKYTIIRYHNIYGPGEDSKGSSPGDIHVIPALIDKVLSGQYPLVFLGSVEATRPFTYVDDAVDATVALVRKVLEGDTNVINNDFNIGPNEATKILDLGKRIWDLLGDGRPFEYQLEKSTAITADRREMIADKLVDVTGWQPKVSLDEGIQKTAEWIKNRKS